MLEGFLILSHIIILSAVLYFVWDSKKKDRTQEAENLSIFAESFGKNIKEVLSFIVDENKKLYESLEKTQVRYFESLSKQAKQSDDLLEKSNKEFLKVFAQVFKKEVHEIPVEVPKKVEADQIENSIEKAFVDQDIPLSETDRIPIVPGIKIKFEDEPEVMSMNINPFEDYQQSENPIESSFDSGSKLTEK